jgi:hypothetical protein
VYIFEFNEAERKTFISWPHHLEDRPPLSGGEQQKRKNYKCIIVWSLINSFYDFPKMLDMTAPSHWITTPSNEPWRTGFKDKILHQESEAFGSGYLAGSESESRNVARKGRRRVKASTRALKLALHSHDLPSRYRHRNKSEALLNKSVDCSWVQRVFDNTPFSASLVANKITSPDDLLCMIDNVQTKTNKGSRNLLLLANSYCKYTKEEGSLQTPSMNQSPEISPGDGMHGSSTDCTLLSDQSDSEETSQEKEHSALVDVVTGLLDECYEDQKTYRSYLPCNQEKCIPVPR